jgi:D-sedoheptulose 7-phosphate isomerase
LVALDRSVSDLARWGAVLHRVLEDGGRVLAAGNGGSAAHAQHLTSELVGRFCRERRAFSAVCLSSDPSALTAIGNDYGFEEVFARQIEAHGRPGDLVVLLSTSGRSPNLLCAASRAISGDLTTLAITGPAPNPLARACHGAISVDARTTASIQDAHQVVVHALCAVFDHLHLDTGARRVRAVSPEEVLCTPSS